MAAVPGKNGPNDPSNKRRPIAQVKCPEHGGVVCFACKRVLPVFLVRSVFCIALRLTAALVARAHCTARFLI